MQKKQKKVGEHGARLISNTKEKARRWRKTNGAVVQQQGTQKKNNGGGVKRGQLGKTWREERGSCFGGADYRLPEK